MKYTIYKCYCNDPLITDTYIGSTTCLEKRIEFHKKDYTEQSHRKLYSFIKEHGGFSNWSFKTVEEGEAKERSEIRIREQHYMNELRPSLNLVKAYLTPEEKRIIRNEARARYRAKYPEKSKAWNDKISKMKWFCEACNHNYPYSIKARHLRTKKHNDNVNGVEQRPVEQRPRECIGESTTRCIEIVETPQKKSFTEQEYLEVLQNPSDYHQFFKQCDVSRC